LKNITVIVSKDNKYAVSDWNARDWYLSLKDGDTATVASSIMLNELRLGVRSGEIAPFSFDFDGKKVSCGDKGQLDEWPTGFMDHLGIQMIALMKGITYDNAKFEVQSKLRVKKQVH